MNKISLWKYNDYIFVVLGEMVPRQYQKDFCFRGFYLIRSNAGHDYHIQKWYLPNMEKI